MSGWGALGDVLGGGFNTDNAYETGRLRTAQTEDALAQARNHQLSSMAQEFKAKNQAGLEDAFLANGDPPEVAHLKATIMNGDLGSNFASMEQGRLRQQEYSGRQTLGDALATPEQQFLAGQQVQGQALPHYNVSGGVAEDLINRNGSLQPTPVGQAQIGAYDALAYDRLHPQPGAGGVDPAVSANPLIPPGLKAPTGSYIDSAYDPNNPEHNQMIVQASGNPQGVNLITQQNRVLEAAGFVGNHLQSMMAMPIGTTQGMQGSGNAPAPDASWSSIISSQLKYGANPQAINEYNATVAGVSGALVALEMQGMRGAASVARQFDALAFRADDGLPRNIGTLMYKAATLRQTLETGLMPMLAQPGTPPDVKAQARALIAQATKDVPWSPTEVLHWQNQASTNPRATIAESTQQAYLHTPVGKQAPAGGAAPSAAPNRPVAHSQAEYDALPSGTEYLMPGESTPRRKP